MITHTELIHHFIDWTNHLWHALQGGIWLWWFRAMSRSDEFPIYSSFNCSNWSCESDYFSFDELVASGEYPVDAERFREHGAERQRESRRKKIDAALQSNQTYQSTQMKGKHLHASWWRVRNWSMNSVDMMKWYQNLDVKQLKSTPQV